MNLSRKFGSSNCSRLSSFNQKKYYKKRLWAIGTAFGSNVRLVASLTLLINFYSFLSLFDLNNIGDAHWSQGVIVNFQQFTSLSNLIAFFCMFIFVIKPYNFMFKKNFFLIAAGTYLWMAGIAFWGILAPTVFLGYGRFLNFGTTGRSVAISRIVSFVWNHTISQISFGIFAYKVIVSTPKNKLSLPKFKEVYFLGYCFIIVYILIAISIPFIDPNRIPVYGVFNNLNPTVCALDVSGKMSNFFDLRISIPSYIFIFLLYSLIVYFCWKMNVKLVIYNDYLFNQIAYYKKKIITKLPLMENKKS